MSKQEVSDYLLERLRTWGVEHVFAFPGDGSNGILAVAEQIPNVLERALRIALAQRAPTALIIPSDVQELPYSPPTHAFKMVPSSLGIEWPAVDPDDAAIQRAAALLNEGSKVAML